MPSDKFSPPTDADDRKADRTPFWQFYTDDWIGGTVGFSFEQKGFYLDVLLRMRARKGGLPHDERWLSGALSCDPRTVRRHLAFLLVEGKLKIRDGLVINERMLRDIEKRRPTSAGDRAKIGRRSGEVRPEIRQTSGEVCPEIAEKKSENPTKSTEPSARQNPPYAREPEARSQSPEAKGEDRDIQPASSQSVAGELAGLNGFADLMISDVVDWMHCGDQRTARQWLGTTLGLYGQAIIRDSYAKLKADIASGSLVARPLQTWTAIARRLKDEPARPAATTPANNIPPWEAKRQATFRTSRDALERVEQLAREGRL